MQITHLYQLATRAAVLGTHRQQLPVELVAAFPALGIREDAPPAEQLLEAIGLLDRLQRVLVPAAAVVPTVAAANHGIDQNHQPLSPRGVNALELALGDTYRLALPEVLELLRVHQYQLPPHFLPAVLDLSLAARKAGAHEFSEQLFALAGSHGNWLAAQHPDWQHLLPPANWAAEFKRIVMPSQRAELLRRWRAHAPAAARAGLEAEWASLNPKQQEALLPALYAGLSQEDAPFLHAALVPRRMEVRRIATLLLLEIPESDVYNQLRTLATNALKLDGPRTWFELDAASLEMLDAYGLSALKKSPAENVLAGLPPQLWLEVSGLKAAEFLPRLLTAGQQFGQALLRAVVHYQSPEWRTLFVRHFIYQDRPQSELSKLTEELYPQLTRQEYQDIVSWALKNTEQVFRPGSVLRAISLQLDHPWPDQLSKLVVNEFTSQFSNGRSSYGYGLLGNALWKILPYRMSTELFPWLRQQLYAATERDDQYGNLATKMLQVLSFRKAVFEELTKK